MHFQSNMNNLDLLKHLKQLMKIAKEDNVK